MTEDELIEAFRVEICAKAAEIDEEFSELDWYDMSIGFFFAKGATYEQASKCARTARYTYEYWC